MTSLEEVFMSIGRLVEEEDARAAPHVAVEAGEVEHLGAEVTADSRVETPNSRTVKALVRLNIFDLMNGQRLRTLYVFPLFFIFLSFFFSSDTSTYEIALYPPLALGWALVEHSLSLIADKSTKRKHVMLVHGVSVPAYWVANMVFAYMTLCPHLLLILAGIFYRGVGDLSGRGLPLLLAEMLVFPISCFLGAANISCMFDNPEFATKTISISNSLFTTVPCLAVYFLVFSVKYRTVGLVVHVLMSLCNPYYGLPGLMILSVQPVERTETELVFLSWRALPIYCFPLIVLIFGLNLLRQDLRSRQTSPGTFKDFGSGRKDEDVLFEESRVLETSSRANDDEAVRFERLSHTHRRRVRGGEDVYAVRGVSCAVKKGECFGLLGPNGAGKTTTLAVLTGELRPPTAGNVKILGHDVNTVAGLQAAYRSLGICPQDDPLFSNVSGREHLMFHGRVKGVSEVHLPREVNSVLARLGLGQDGDRKACEYSGGMRRKLSVGLALIGYSDVTFLDEPSAAVDAVSKRHLWKALKRRVHGQTVVVTTHSMEEAEALCGRIAMQVKGQLRCLGTPSHLKTKYGSGYQVELYCDHLKSNYDASQAKEKVTTFVVTRIDGDATLLEFHASRFVFQLSPMREGGCSLGSIFTELEQHRHSLGITDYSVTQSSLEQVFLRLAREQDEPDETVEGATTEMQVLSAGGPYGEP